MISYQLPMEPLAKFSLMLKCNQIAKKSPVAPAFQPGWTQAAACGYLKAGNSARGLVVSGFLKYCSLLTAHCSLPRHQQDQGGYHNQRQGSQKLQDFQENGQGVRRDGQGLAPLLHPSRKFRPGMQVLALG
jgi:hypothetical protein